MSEDHFEGHLNFYQNANADADTVKQGFLVRQYEYSVIMGDLVRNPGKGSVQHYLLLGRRGSGKSTLLRRLQVEIDTDQQLRSAYIAINLAEEQANIYRLFDLLEEVVRELEHRDIEIEGMEFESDAYQYSRQLFYVIHRALEKTGKKLVLLLDNIDRIFENLGDEVSLLRENLENHSDIKIIGGSTRMTEHFWAYDKPFYEFFRVLELKPLKKDEVKELLLNWSIKLNVPQLKDFVESKPGQLETIRILTDGLPRTLQFFVNILLTHNQETGYEYLRLLMDKVTPLYQERLNHLPPSQRKIVLQLAFLWEAAGAKELALATRMETRVISAQLNQLIEKGVADKIETKTKNHLYRLSERFFNLWLIFTQGGPQERRRARYLTIFLENFYDEQELNEMAEKHSIAVANNRIPADKAVLLTKAFSQSRYIDISLRDLLIGYTMRLPGINKELEKEIPALSKDIINEMNHLVVLSKWDQVIRVARSIEQDHPMKNEALGLSYWGKGDLDEAEKYFLKALQATNEYALIHPYRINPFSDYLIYFYECQGRLEDVEKLILSYNALFDLCLFYYKWNWKKEEALSVIKLLVPMDDSGESLKLLPVIRVWAGDFKEIEDQLAVLIRGGELSLNFTLTHLLVHHQVNLVLHLFMSREFGLLLKERYLPIFYASQLLISGPELTAIKIPPEIREPVNVLLADILHKRDYYYHAAELENHHKIIDHLSLK